MVSFLRGNGHDLDLAMGDCGQNDHILPVPVFSCTDCRMRHPYHAHTRQACDCMWSGRASVCPVFPGDQSGRQGMAGVSVLLLCITLLAPGSFGGGDIKLMAVSGLFLGWEGNLRAFSLAVFTAGAFCLWMLLWGKLERKARISFAPFICAGILMQITGSGCLW